MLFYIGQTRSKRSLSPGAGSFKYIVSKTVPGWEDKYRLRGLFLFGFVCSPLDDVPIYGGTRSRLSVRSVSPSFGKLDNLVRYPVQSGQARGKAEWKPSSARETHRRLTTAYFEYRNLHPKYRVFTY
ncbi:unnamed protein product [Leptosia nina]|uniref:Uncharacterized protein n=1 Tax=Leptosia nina TaxID=320188 RepID=A0AAV1K1M6_9NEOP